jgi:hypothetical protein
VCERFRKIGVTLGLAFDLTILTESEYAQKLLLEHDVLVPI